MYTIISKVDINKGNYESVFLYTVNASFSGISGNAKDIQIRMFIPEYLTMYLGDIADHVKEIKEEQIEGGKNVIFDFGEIEDLGIAVRLGFGINFNDLAKSGQKFKLNSAIYIDDVLETDNIADEIELEVIPRFEISREIVLPAATPSPGSEVYFKVVLENFEDLGGEINNIQIICNATDEFQIDEDFEVIGEDVSDKFKDDRYDNVKGEMLEGNIVFNIPEYKGQRYQFIYKGKINNDVAIGDKVVTFIDWSINDIEEESDINTIVLADKIYSVSIPIYGPDFTIPLEYIGYEFNIKNTGNQPLENVSIEEVLSNKISYYEFKTGIFHISGINKEIDAEYSISYTTILGETGVLGPFNTNKNETVDLQFILDEEDNIRTLKWELIQLSVGVESKVPPKIDGIVKEDTELNNSIINQLEFKYLLDGEEEEIPNSKSTMVQNTCYLNTTFSQSLNNIPVNPGTTLTYSIGASCRESRLIDPIIAFLLPKELEYIDSATISYTDYFKDSATPKLPPAVIIENINENGDSFVKFEFKDEYSFDFRQKSNFEITFNAKVKIGATGEFETFMILNTFSATEYIPSNSDLYRDDNNIANDDNVSYIYAKSSENSNKILFYVSTKSNKKVKGVLDSEYLEEPFIGSTTSGSNIEYKISITNIGNVPLEKVEIVDILPHVEDKSVLFTEVERESEFSVYAISEIKSTILDNENNKTDATFDVYYSDSYNPVRFGPSFNTIGIDDNWSLTIPDDLSNLKSFKIITKDVKLNPSEVIEVTVLATAPTGVPLENVAWNSFAADTMYKDINNVETHMLAIEPEKVGIEVVDTPEDKGIVNGFVWFDNNKDGMPDVNEKGMNDVGVVLVNEDNIVIDYAFTNPDFNNNDGYYTFNNIVFGNYKIVFFIPDKYVFTTTVLDQVIGNKVNMKTDSTDIFTINENNRELIINGGLIDKPLISIEELLEVNNSVNKTFKNVIRNQLLITMKMEDVSKLIEDLK